MKLETPKKCGCGKTHAEVPPNAKPMIEGDELDGLYWNCDCGTTLFTPVSGLSHISLTTDKLISEIKKRDQK